MDNACLKSWADHFSFLRIKDLMGKELRKKMEEDERARQANQEAFWDKLKKSSDEIKK